ncbi:hypothetical protein M885DRAFT_518562 [Pelagophyceae sp. CCMP2097]|nr:hypothetical protein M885DRAFT_518562 [Pelagophyceae sp. CCMP2097]
MNHLRRYGDSAQSKFAAVKAGAVGRVGDGLGLAKKAISSEACDLCGEKRNALRIQKCTVCGKSLCGPCSFKTAVPSSLRQDDEDAAATIVCKTDCADRVNEAHLAVLRSALTQSHLANVEAFLQGDSDEFYARPDAAKTKTDALSTAQRLTPLALDALKLCGYGEFVYAYKLAEGGIAAVLLTPMFKVFVERVVPILRKHQKATGLVCYTSQRGAVEAELGLRLYYLGCTEAIVHLRGESPAAGAFGYSSSDDSAKSDTPVDQDLLLELGHWVGASQWLYAAHELRAPHDTPGWAAWYVARLCARAGGWSVVACVGASRSEDFKCAIPTRRPTHFPSWCLVARRSDKSAVLSLRGSTTPDDWKINADTDTVEVPSSTGQDYKAHGGVLRAAFAILDDCGAGACIEKLREEGYSLTVVGHSLGAGVAALITFLLNDRDAASKRARCFAYACPAAVNEALAAALLKDVTAVVHNDDMVPRLSDANCAQLADELVRDDANYRQRFDKDRAAYTAHVRTLGKAQAMSHTDVMAAAEAKAPAEEEAKEAKAPAPAEAKAPAPAEAKPSASAKKGAKDEPEAVRLVVPGLVVFLHGRDGFYRAHAGPHQAIPALGRVVVTQRAVTDHNVDAYARALRGVRNQRGFVSEKRRDVVYEPAVRPDGSWTPCAVCGSDVAWTSFVPGSDAARAGSTHHCRACGVVVCAFCAPAGDSVAGDGIHQYVTLPDRRISLPSRDCIEPARVCRPCSFQAFDL